MTKDEAMKRLIRDDTEHGVEYYRADEVDVLMAEQPVQQEPVAWPCVIAEADFEQNTITLEMQCSDYKVGAGQHWLSTFSPQRTWVGLTDEQKQIIKFAHSKMGMMIISYDLDAMLEDIEAKLKEKNT